MTNRPERKVTEPHLDSDELEEVVERLMPIVDEYGWLGIEEAVAEIKRRVIDGELE